MTAIASPINETHLRIVQNTSREIPLSQVKTFSLCPMQWQLSQTHDAESVSSSKLFNSAFRKTVLGYYKARMAGLVIGKSELLDLYQSYWGSGQKTSAGQDIPVHYTSKATPEVLQALTERMFDVFLEHEDKRENDIIVVDRDLILKLDDSGLSFKVHVDLIEAGQDTCHRPNIHIVDFKASSKKLHHEDIDRSALDLAAIAVRQSGLSDGLPVILRSDIITKTKSPEYMSLVFDRSDRQELRALAKARAIAAGMGSGIVYPVHGWQCSGCGYCGQCAQWPDCA